MSESYKMCLKLTFTFFLYFVLASCRKSIVNRIVGGRYCKIDDNPFVVQVFALETKAFSQKVKFFSCGGSLLNSRWVLTAAHCVYSKSLVKSYTVHVQAGKNRLELDEKAIGAEKIIPHSLYRGKHHDIALIYLKKPYEMSSPYAKLPPFQGFDRNCTIGKIVGWGREQDPGVTTPDPNTPPPVRYLKCAEVEITGKGGCSVYGYDLRSRLKFDGSLLYVLVGLDQVDACLGDSGGPLLCNGVLIGVVESGLECGDVGACSLYTRTEAYFHFIKKHTGLKLSFDSKPTDPIYVNEYKAFERKKVEEKTHSGSVKNILDYKLNILLVFVYVLYSLL